MTYRIMIPIESLKDEMFKKKKKVYVLPHYTNEPRKYCVTFISWFTDDWVCASGGTKKRNQVIGVTTHMAAVYWRHR